jgi:uncharacterized protein YbjT (DUF2867 family)
MILLVGATGTTGREVAKALTAAKVPFRSLLRSSKVAKEWQAQGADVVVGDLEKPKTLQPALEGITRAFLLTSPSKEVVRLHGDFVAAAVKTGVRHVVRLGALGANPTSAVSLFRWHGEADEALRSSGLRWTLLRPHFFMQNFVTFHVGSIVSQDAFYLPMGTGRISPVDVRDVAQVAVRALTQDGHEGKAYDLTGPDVLSMADMAQTLSRALGRTISYVAVTPEASRAALLHGKVPEWLADALLELYADFAAGRGAVLTGDVSDVTGRMPRSFERFVQDHAAAFRKP